MDTHAFTDTPLGNAIELVGDLLGVNVCYFYRGSFHFRLAGREGMTLAISPESAGRFCVEVCHLTAIVDRKWVPATDQARLASLVRDASEHATAVV